MSARIITTPGRSPSRLSAMTKRLWSRARPAAEDRRLIRREATYAGATRADV